MPAVEVSEISVRFGNLQALERVSFTVEEGELVSLLGPSGCGKTTLLNILADILQPTEGSVRVNGDSSRTARRRREIGFVFQEPALLKNRTALENVGLPMEIAGVPKNTIKERAQKALELVGLSGFENFLTHNLSGGMKQRVAIARVFATEYRLLLMDEPFGALDAHTREKMGFELLQIWQEAGNKRTIIFVTHDPNEAAFLSDRIIFLSGRPGSVKAQIEIDFPRPRLPVLRTTEEFFQTIITLRKLYNEEGS